LSVWQIRGVAIEHRRHVEVRPFPRDRRLVIGAMRAGRRATPMHGLLDLDVTEATRLLRQWEPALSFTAFVVASVARAAAAHPEVHAYRNWRGELVSHRHVDVATIVEVDTAQGPFPLAHVARDAGSRDVADLTAELRRIKRDGRAQSESGWLARAAMVGTRVPGVIPVLYAAMGRSVRVRQRIGTVGVTAVGMFAGGGGFGITPLTVMSLQVLVGGITARPRAIGGDVQIRDVVDLTVTIDHNVVDGAPAARFGADLRQLIEHASLLRSDVSP
jgi:pyruvate/2-oxoglutarate dehydrogenase complex dihydrolipoamide acyltransferase (E2) component